MPETVPTVQSILEVPRKPLPTPEDWIIRHATVPGSYNHGLVVWERPLNDYGRHRNKLHFRVNGEDLAVLTVTSDTSGVTGLESVRLTAVVDDPLFPHVVTASVILRPDKYPATEGLASMPVLRNPESVTSERENLITAGIPLLSTVRPKEVAHNRTRYPDAAKTAQAILTAATEWMKLTEEEIRSDQIRLPLEYSVFDDNNQPVSDEAVRRSGYYL